MVEGEMGSIGGDDSGRGGEDLWGFGCVVDLGFVPDSSRKGVWVGEEEKC
jgi:hypothetical protein